MKKIILIAMAALCLDVISANGQVFEKGGIELTDSDKKTSVDLRIGFPMNFAWSTLVQTDYKNEWAAAEAVENDFLKLNVGKSFTYAFDMVGLKITNANSPVEFSLAVRWTFMDFVLNPNYTFAGENRSYLPVPVKMLNPDYTTTKSKIHGSYVGVPFRIACKAGSFKFFAGISAEYLVEGYAKFRSPAERRMMPNLFYRFRSAVEAGVCFKGLGVYASYGITPLFPDSLSDARTLTFGLVLGM